MARSQSAQYTVAQARRARRMPKPDVPGAVIAVAHPQGVAGGPAAAAIAAALAAAALMPPLPPR